jgi:hypothetical protein
MRGSRVQRNDPLATDPVISWGRMDVEGLDIGKDVKLYPGGGRPWDWSETGTRHNPGKSRCPAGPATSPAQLTESARLAERAHAHGEPAGDLPWR